MNITGLGTLRKTFFIRGELPPFGGGIEFQKMSDSLDFSPIFLAISGFFKLRPKLDKKLTNLGAFLGLIPIGESFPNFLHILYSPWEPE